MFGLMLGAPSPHALSVLFVAIVVGAVMEVLTGFVTAPGATLTALTMAAGDSLQVRQSTSAKNIRLMTWWAQNQVAGIGRIRSPRMHDNVQGIRSRVTITDSGPRMPLGWGQPLFSQDTLIAELSGSAVGGQIETMCLCMYYDSIDGSSANLISAADVQKRGVQEMAVETVHAFGAAGGYSGQVAINSTTDLGIANKNYALVGYNVTAECAMIGWRGVDTGNFRVGGPGRAALPHLTGEWFLRLSDEYGVPMVPVFNFANKGAILVDGAQSQAAAAVTVTSFFVELA